MGKALKTFLILNLLLSAVVVWFGIEHFSNRQVIKARGLILEDTMRTVAQNLAWGREAANEERLRSTFANNTVGQAPEQLDRQDVNTAPFSVPQPVMVEELGTLEQAMNELSRFATQRLALLNQRTEQLIIERERHQAEFTAHVNTEAVRVQTQQDLDRTRATLQSTQNDLAQARRQIDQLNTEKSSLERQVENLNVELTDRNDRIASLEIDIEARTQELRRATERIMRLEAQVAGRTADQGRWIGVPGTILEVDTRWQYVVIDLGEVDGLELFLRAIVHRGDELIGEIAVIRVENTVAIAEIKTETVPEGVNIQPGDQIFFM